MKRYFGGEGRIRTDGTLKTYTGFRVRRIRPLCHLSRFVSRGAKAEILTERGLQQFDAAHVGPEGIRHGDRAVGVLVILQYRHQRAADGQAGSVERMDHLVPALRISET